MEVGRRGEKLMFPLLPQRCFVCGDSRPTKTFHSDAWSGHARPREEVVNDRNGISNEAVSAKSTGIREIHG